MSMSRNLMATAIGALALTLADGPTVAQDGAAARRCRARPSSGDPTC